MQNLWLGALREATLAQHPELPSVPTDVGAKTILTQELGVALLALNKLAIRTGVDLSLAATLAFDEESKSLGSDVRLTETGYYRTRPHHGGRDKIVGGSNDRA